MSHTQIAISVPSELNERFTLIAKKFGTNRSNLISMYMANVVNTKKVYFDANDFNIESEIFSSKELNKLKKGGKVSYDAISNLIDK